MADLLTESLTKRDRAAAAFDAARGGRSRFARMLSSGDATPSEQLSREKFDYEKQRDSANDAFKAAQATQRAEVATGRAEIADERLKLSQDQYAIQQKQYELQKAREDAAVEKQKFQLDKAIQAADESTAFIKEFGAIDHRDADYEQKVMQLGSKYSLGAQDPQVQSWVAKGNGYRENYLKTQAESNKLQAAKDLAQAQRDQAKAAGLVQTAATIEGGQFTKPKIPVQPQPTTRTTTDANGNITSQTITGPAVQGPPAAGAVAAIPVTPTAPTVAAPTRMKYVDGKLVPVDAP